MLLEDVLRGGNKELVDRLGTAVDELDADDPEEVPAVDVEEPPVDNVEERIVTLPVLLDLEIVVDPDRLVLPPVLVLDGVIDATGVTDPLVLMVGVAEEVAAGGGPAELEVATDGLRVDTEEAVVLTLD